MRALFGLTLVFLALFQAGGVWACEKHLNGHQNSSDTNNEATKR